MASNRQNEANRNNARRSTGPKTESGKTKSRSNARLHGLSRPMSYDECNIEVLSDAITKVLDGNVSAPDFDPTDIVRAKLELHRIRTVRYELLAELLNGSDPRTVKRLQGLERYERLAFAKQRRAIKRSATQA